MRPLRAIAAAAVAVAGLSGCTFDPLPASAFRADAAVAEDDASAGDPDAAPRFDAGTPDDAGAARPDGGSAASDAGDVDAGAMAVCGDGRIELLEACDDENTTGGDGCSPTCEVEGWWRCEGEPSVCAALPDLEVRDVTVAEGEPARFAVELSAPAPFDVTFLWSTVDGGAVTPDDYTSVTGGAVTIPVGEAAAELVVDTRADLRTEGDEAFEVELSAVRGARPADVRGEATIVDVPALADTGLIARYFLDDAPPGSNVQFVADAAPDPLNLRVVSDGPEPAFVEDPTGRGLAWSDVNSTGRVGVDLAGTKIRSRLEGRTTATLEVVADVRAMENASRLIHIGDRSVGRLSMLINDENVFLALNDVLYEWELPDSGVARRVVYHLVLDTTLGRRSERARLYLDGADQGEVEDRGPGQDTAIDLQLLQDFLIGNRTGGYRAIQGRIYYAAVYDAALTPAEVAQNAGVLANQDDP